MQRLRAMSFASWFWDADRGAPPKSFQRPKEVLIESVPAARRPISLTFGWCRGSLPSGRESRSRGRGRGGHSAEGGGRGDRIAARCRARGAQPAVLPPGAVKTQTLGAEVRPQTPELPDSTSAAMCKQWTPTPANLRAADVISMHTTAQATWHYNLTHAGPPLRLWQVTPVLGIISEAARDALKPSEAEVAVVFDAPLCMFLRESRRHSYQDVQWAEGVPYRLHFFEHRQMGQTFNIWVGPSVPIVCVCVRAYVCACAPAGGG